MNDDIVLFVPWVSPAGKKQCAAMCPEAVYLCTRLDGHTGRHKASGVCRPNGTAPVFAVWADS